MFRFPSNCFRIVFLEQSLDVPQKFTTRACQQKNQNEFRVPRLHGRKSREPKPGKGRRTNFRSLPFCFETGSASEQASFSLEMNSFFPLSLALSLSRTILEIHLILPLPKDKTSRNPARNFLLQFLSFITRRFSSLGMSFPTYSSSSCLS